MKDSLLADLASPCCEGDLDLTVDAFVNGEVTTGGLTCRRCGARYPIKGAVPRFVGDDAYSKSFSFEWTRFRTLQLDSQNGQTWSREAFVERTGLAVSSLHGKKVLDVGCGTGRFSEIVLDGGGEVVGVDLSYAVDVAQTNVGFRPRAHIVQADVFALPFREGVFDRVVSLGVLHHTPDAQQAFLRLPRHMRPGGTIAIWVYARGRWFGVFADVARLITTRMPRAWLYRLCRHGVPLMHRLTRLPLIGPVFHLLPTSDKGRGLEADILDTFDWYSPRYQSKHDEREVRGWFESAHLTDIRALSFPVSVRGQKP